MPALEYAGQTRRRTLLILALIITICVAYVVASFMLDADPIDLLDNWASDFLDEAGR